MSRSVINFAAFNIVWYVNVSVRTWAAPLVALWALLPHFALVAADRKRAARVLVAAALAGTLADTLLERAGLLTFAGGPRVWIFCPLWITALWVNFGTTLHGCLAWLHRRLPLAAALGALAAPLTYLLAERLGAVTLHRGALPALAGEYAVATPALLALARRRDA